MNIIKKGSTDVTRYVMLVDSAAGTPETGYTITNLDLQYTRNRTAPAAKVDATALATTDSAHTDNQAIQIDATSSPGLYRVDWPDAAFATGVDKVLLVISGTGLHPAVEEIQLVNYDPEDATRLGLTALPNADAQAAGGLYTRGTGAGQINQPANGQIDANVAAMATGIITAAAIAADAIGASELAADAVTEIQSGLSTLTLAQVRTALGVTSGDILAELGVASPSATPSLGAAVMLLYMALRNKFTADSGTGFETIHNDALAAVCKAAITDAANVFTKGEFAAP